MGHKISEAHDTPPTTKETHSQNTFRYKHFSHITLLDQLRSKQWVLTLPCIQITLASVVPKTKTHVEDTIAIMTGPTKMTDRYDTMPTAAQHYSTAQHSRTNTKLMSRLGSHWEHIYLYIYTELGSHFLHVVSHSTHLVRDHPAWHTTKPTLTRPIHRPSPILCPTHLAHWLPLGLTN